MLDLEGMFGHSLLVVVALDFLFKVQDLSAKLEVFGQKSGAFVLEGADAEGLARVDAGDVSVLAQKSSPDWLRLATCRRTTHAESTKGVATYGCQSYRPAPGLRSGEPLLIVGEQTNAGGKATTRSGGCRRENGRSAAFTGRGLATRCVREAVLLASPYYRDKAKGSVFFRPWAALVHAGCLEPLALALVNFGGVVYPNLTWAGGLAGQQGHS